MTFRVALILMLLVTGGCSDERKANLDQKMNKLNARLEAAENEIQNIRSDISTNNEKYGRINNENLSRNDETSAEVIARRNKNILLVDSNNVGNFGSLAACQRAASKVNRDADVEQQKIDELNRLEFEKVGPPGIIRGRAKRHETQCLELSQ